MALYDAESMSQTGADAANCTFRCSAKIDDTLKSFGYAAPAVARIASADVYFAPGIYEKLKAERLRSAQ